MKRKILLCCILCSFLCGCQKMNSVETYDYVLALGVEHVGKGYLFSYSSADISKIQDNAGIKVPSNTVTVWAKNFQDGKKIWEKRTGRPLNFSQLKIVVAKPLDEVTEKEIKKQREISNTVDVVETQKKMKDLFAMEKKIPISFGEYMEEVLH